jgi:hypothetical protein
MSSNVSPACTRVEMLKVNIVSYKHLRNKDLQMRYHNLICKRILYSEVKKFGLHEFYL